MRCEGRAFIALALATATMLCPQSALAQDGASSEDELFEELFGEAPPKEGPDDILLVEAITVEKPEDFTEAFVRSFAKEVTVGKRYARADLKSRLSAIDERMRLSGMFYEGRASYRRTGGTELGGTELGGTTSGGTELGEVVLTVSEGFYWNFNFYPWDPFVGYSNFAKSGKTGALTLGLNTQELQWTDPAIEYSRWVYQLTAHHSVKYYGGGADSYYLGELVRGGAELGFSFTENFRLGAGGGYVCVGAPPSYFLYPEYKAPNSSELASLDLSGRADYFEGLFDLSILEYDYQRTGGLHGRIYTGSRVYVPLESGRESAVKLYAEGSLRYDTPVFLSLVLFERAEAFPWIRTSSDVPDPLRADIEEFRCARGLQSGEFSSQSRLSLDCDFKKPIFLGFTGLSLIPQLYYEIAFVRRVAYSDRVQAQQGIGAVMQFSFSRPVGRVFSLGIGFCLPGIPGFIPAQSANDSLAASFVFEVK